VAGVMGNDLWLLHLRHRSLLRPSLLASGLRRGFVGLAVSRPTPLRGFSDGSQTCRRHLPFFVLRRCWLRLLPLLRCPSRPLSGGDPGAAGCTHPSALLRTRRFRSGCFSLWPARSSLPQLGSNRRKRRCDSCLLCFVSDQSHLKNAPIHSSRHSSFSPSNSNCNLPSYSNPESTHTRQNWRLCGEVAVLGKLGHDALLSGLPE